MTNQHPVLSSRYFYLLISLIAYFILSPLFVTRFMEYQLISVLFSLVIIFSANIVTHGRKVMILTVTLGTLSLAGTWYVNFEEPNVYLHVIHFAITISFLSTITCSVLYSITKHQSISADTLLGAICGYLLIGATWSFIYLIISELDHNAITENLMSQPLIHRVHDATYFSFITLTTTGYGDILPRTCVAKSWTWLEAVTGQFYLAVWISRLVGLQIAQRFARKLDAK